MHLVKPWHVSYICYRCGVKINLLRHGQSCRNKDHKSMSKNCISPNIHILNRNKMQGERL